MDETSSTGLSPRVVAVAAYLLGLISGLIVLTVEKQSSYVRFHAAQSTVVFGAVVMLGFILAAVPLVGSALRLAFGVGVLVLWVLLIVKAAQGERYKVPHLGEFAERHLM